MNSLGLSEFSVSFVEGLELDLQELTGRIDDPLAEASAGVQLADLSTHQPLQYRARLVPRPMSKLIGSKRRDAEVTFAIHVRKQLKRLHPLSCFRSVWEYDVALDEHSVAVATDLET